MSMYLAWALKENIRKKSPILQLDNCRLNVLPKEIENFYWLKELHLNGNGLSTIGNLSKLKELENLRLSNNNFEDLSFLKCLKNIKYLDLNSNRISSIEPISNLENLERLQISNNYIQSLSGLKKCKNLTVLNISFNQVVSLDEIEALKNLNVLNLSNNLVTNLHGLEPLKKLHVLIAENNTIENIGNLINKNSLKQLNLAKNNIRILENCNEFKNIISIDLSHNLIENIDSSDQLKNLKSINLDNNNIKDLELIIPLLEKGFVINKSTYDVGNITVLDNPISLPPKEIIHQGEKYIIDFYKDIEKQGSAFLYEAKLLILGESGAGKTTLSRKIVRDNAKMPDEADSTMGIDIKKFFFKTSRNNKFRINIWDFGGQEIYHATHQFFLTQRSLYLLVCDSRKEDTDFNYWLQVVELLSGKSPLMIIQNEKFGRKVDIDIRGLKQNFDFILDSYSIDLKNDIPKLHILKNDIKSHIQKLQHIGQELPKQWVEIRKNLEIIAKDKNYIIFNDYNNICNNNKIYENDKILRLSRYLHDIGVFLHFQDDVILKHYIFLNNEWITNAVYHVLDDTKIQFDNSGHFSKEYLKNIWCDLKYDEMSDELIQLMKNFELCYEIPEKQNEYIAPQLLPKEQPEFNLSEFDGLQLKYDYDFLPKGLISRLIVRLHKYIDSIQLVWRYGMILTKNQARALIVETYGKRIIHIRMMGNYQVEFLTIIQEELDQLNKTYSEIKFKKLIPCFCKECKGKKEPFYFNYADLIRRIERRKFYVECEFSYETLKVNELLNRITETMSSKESPFRLFISYSKKDETFKDQLLTALSPLRREEKIIAWYDHLIAPGEEWNERILDEIELSEIIILLVSADFINTNYIWDIEISKALEKHKHSEAIVIPIIIRPCDWENLPFARINVLPRKGTPISESKNFDRAWTNIIKEIRELITNLKEDKIVRLKKERT